MNILHDILNEYLRRRSEKEKGNFALLRQVGETFESQVCKTCTCIQYALDMAYTVWLNAHVPVYF